MHQNDIDKEVLAKMRKHFGIPDATSNEDVLKVTKDTLIFAQVRLQLAFRHLFYDALKPLILSARFLEHFFYAILIMICLVLIYERFGA